MGIKHIVVLLLIIVILGAQYQLPIRIIILISFRKSKAKWSLNSVATSQYFLIWDFHQKNSFVIISDAQCQVSNFIVMR